MLVILFYAIIIQHFASSTFICDRFGWFGCPIDTVDDVCTALPTTFTDTPGWRQISFDSVNSIFYFCDYNPIKAKNVCFSTADGATWNGMFVLFVYVNVSRKNVKIISYRLYFNDVRSYLT